MGRKNRGTTKRRVRRIGNYAIASSIDEPNSISCTTFNILAPIYKRLNHEDQSCRESDYKANWLSRNNRILDWLLFERSSIICLQEVWVGNEELVGMYDKRLGDARYINFKLARTNNRGDGLLTAVHKDYFRVIAHRELLFNDFGDRVAQLLHVELTAPFAQCRTNNVRQEMLIVNTHLLHKRTAISRLLLTAPNNDAPDVFKNIKNHRYEFLRKNRMRIRRLQLEDSARYECDCPDCEEALPKRSRDLYVMKLAEPKWIIEPGLPLHENTQATIKCQVEDFYPYVNHRILRNDEEISRDGKMSEPTSPLFPQKFLWEKTISPTADWHNSTLRCLVTEGNSEQQATQTLDVLFAPRFLVCQDRQHLDPQAESPVVECSFSGNPSPTLIWRRQNDQRIIGPEPGVTIETKDEQNGRYRSILRFNRTKLASMPVSSNANGTADENYYQEFLSGGFIAQLTINNVEKAKQIIRVDRHAGQPRSSSSNRGERSRSLLSAVLLLSSLVLDVAIFLL